MNMKQFGVAALAALLAFSMIGCGGSDKKDSDDPVVVSFTGTWRLTFTYADSDVEAWTTTLTQTGSTATGTSHEDGEEDYVSTVTATIVGSTITVREVDPDGYVYIWTGTLTGNTLSGSGAYDNGDSPSTFTGTRQ